MALPTQQAGDIASLVRVYCFLDDLDSAAKVVASSSDASASFHLAQQFEKIGNIPQAIHFFAKSGKVGHAAVLAMKYGVDGELLPLSLQSTKQVMLSAAKYFEAKGMHEEAVLLFQKGGDLEKAIAVCARSQLFNALEAISDNLDESTDLCLLERCGECLLQHQQFEKAVIILSAAQQHRQALEIVCS